MRAAIPAALIGLLAVVLTPAAVRSPVPLPTPPARQDPPPRLSDIARDLKLVAELKSGKTIDAGANPCISLTLENTSTSLTYPVVKPGDGSEMGWRDPYVYFTAEQLVGDDRWVPVERAPYSRCGVCDGNWMKDVMDLKPGERLRLDSPDGAIPPEFQVAGRVRVVGHYAYRATGGRGGGPRPEALRGRMKGVPLFEVRSEPIELEVVRPLDVRVRVKRPMRVDDEHRLSDILDVTVVNLTSAPLPLKDPDGVTTPHLFFELNGTMGGWRPSFFDSSGTTSPFAGHWWKFPAELPTGSEVPLLGADRLDGTWTYPRAETVRVRAEFRAKIRGSTAVVRSEWVEVKVEKSSPALAAR